MEDRELEQYFTSIKEDFDGVDGRLDRIDGRLQRIENLCFLILEVVRGQGR